MEQKPGMNIGELAIRGLAVFGFLAIMGIGLWGTAAIARGVPGAFSALAAAIVSLTSIFVPASEALELSAPLSIQTGTPFSVSWTHEQKTVEGSYTFRYDCAEGVSFTSPTESGTHVTVFCNTPFNFLNAENAISLTAASTQNRFVDVTLHIDFTPNGASRPTVSGLTTITVENTGVTGSPTATGTVTPPTTPRPSTPVRGPETSNVYTLTSTSTAPVSNPNGFTDLSARVLELGIVDTTTGAFTASSSPSRTLKGYRIAVRFAVENNGTRTSPQWTFNAVLPTYPAHIFSSPTQQALGPGDRIEFTIGFDSFVNADQGTLIINVDPTNRINEPNKTNNIVNYTVLTIK